MCMHSRKMHGLSPRGMVVSRISLKHQAIYQTDSELTYFHMQVLRYLEEYATHHDLAKDIQFATTVRRIVPDKDGGYQVSIQLQNTHKVSVKHFKTVIVANGHHWDPSYPVLPGKFSGQMIHAHQYRNHSVLDNKAVLVLGMGNSGA